MKTFLAVVAVLVVGAVTAVVLNFVGVFAFSSMDGHHVAADISAKLSAKAGQTVHVTCPSKIPKKKGGIEDCEASAGHGTTLIRVVQDDSRGHFHYTVSDPEAIVPEDKVSPTVTDRAEGGTRVIDCVDAVSRPDTLTFACADAGIYAHRLTWDSFGGATSSGRGELAIKACEPNCAEGHFDEYPILISLSGVEQGAVGPVYTHARLTYVGRRPPGSGDLEEFDLPTAPSP